MTACRSRLASIALALSAAVAVSNIPTGNVCLAEENPTPSEPASAETARQSAADHLVARQNYDRDVLPILEQYCFGCHAEGAEEGDFAIDDYPSEQLMFADSRMWWSVLKNVRADVMPPEGEEQPTASEKQTLFDWITRYPFGAATGQIDPGRNVLRRLNRLEYRNTIRDLMGIDFDTSVEFPPDDSGDGFDNNADALSISPLLAEKYIAAAKQIVDSAVPKAARVIPVQSIDEDRFEIDIDTQSTRLSFDTAATATMRFSIDTEAEYRLIVPIEIDGSFDFHPSRAHVQVVIDDQVVHDKEYGWRTDFVKRLSLERPLSRGEHSVQFKLTPAESKKSDGDDEKIDGTFVRLDLPTVRVEGPLDPDSWLPPPRYDRFFHRDTAPQDPADRTAYAAEVLRRFCNRAYRRPVDRAHLQRLLALAGLDDNGSESASTGSPNQSGSPNELSFEERIGRAMVAVLASPRFLFRIEQPVAGSQARFPEIDDYSLASRLSYFLWSTMPDEELFQLAGEGTLRDHLKPQVQRMLADDRSSTLIENFVGQWLQTRDVESVSIDPLAALGLREEYDRLRDYLESTETGRREPRPDAPPEHQAAYKRYREIREFRGRLDADVRRDMRLETERAFAYVLRENRSLLELIDSNYAFLNERLAAHYGVPGVQGDSIRRVDLPDDSPLGGVLTQGTFLLVTSNPTRTSPVKRGLFILDNILGTPAPPAPAAVPELEASAERTAIKDPTLRQLLELHRSEPLCRSCHARFDPLGLAFENFTAMGTWRERENGRPIEPAGQLISGESFDNVTELKRILAGPRHQDFYHCLAERMLSYAIGRSLDFRDEVVLDQIADALEADQGRSRTLIDAVVQSAVFRRMRRIDDPPIQPGSIE